MTRQPGRRRIEVDPTELLITDIPRFELKELDAALSAFIHWHTRSCVTRAERANRDASFVALRQAHWNVGEAVKKLNPTRSEPTGTAPSVPIHASTPAATRPPWWRREFRLFGKRRQAKAA